MLFFQSLSTVGCVTMGDYDATDRVATTNILGMAVARQYSIRRWNSNEFKI